MTRFKKYTLARIIKIKTTLQKIKLPRLKRKVVIPATLASAATPVSTAGIAATVVPTKNKEVEKVSTTDTGKPVKLNKDGTPRKARNDAGKKRGNYKPRAS